MQSQSTTILAQLSSISSYHQGVRMRVQAAASIFWGIVTVIAGALDQIWIFTGLGTCLLLEGIWLVWDRRPRVFVIDGITVLCIGMWNLRAGLLIGHAPVWTLGILQMVWGIESIARYPAFEALASVATSADALRRMASRMAASLPPSAVASPWAFRIGSRFRAMSFEDQELPLSSFFEDVLMGKIFLSRVTLCEPGANEFKKPSDVSVLRTEFTPGDLDVDSPPGST